MTLFLNRTVFLVFWLSVSAGFAQKTKPAAPASNMAGQPIKLWVDASHAPEKILRAQMQIPLVPGPLTLVYPKWSAGEHGPTAPITDLTGPQVLANAPRVAC